MVKDAWQASSLFVNLNCSCSLTLEAIFKDSSRQKDSTAFLKVIQVVLGLGRASEEPRREHKLQSYSSLGREQLLRTPGFKSDLSKEISHVMMLDALPRAATVHLSSCPCECCLFRIFKDKWLPNELENQQTWMTCDVITMCDVPCIEPHVTLDSHQENVSFQNTGQQCLVTMFNLVVSGHFKVPKSVLSRAFFPLCPDPDCNL